MTGPSGDPIVGRTIAHYEVVARVGGGGMGVVYRARDTRLGRTVALKFLPQQWSHDEDARQRFLREAQAASATNHPNICTIHDIETADDGQLFIVMAYYDGETLKQRLASGPIAVEEALGIATQIADGLAKAHAQGVVHRDVKPGNVMLTEDGVRLLDFGLATFADALKLTADHATLGTAAYMSPEQVRGQSADVRSDVWAVGVILYEMLAGHAPFQGSHAEAIAYAVRHETPAPLRAARPDIGEQVEQLVFRALHKDPAVRFANGRELARALRQVRGLSVPVDLWTQTVDVKPLPDTLTRDRRWRRRRPAAVLALVAAGLIAAAWWFSPVRRETIVVAPVVNQTGDGSLQPYQLALTYSLERALAESSVVRPVPHAQVMPILQRFIVGGLDVSSRDAIQALSARSGAQVVVVPALLYENGAMRARAEFLNPATATPLGDPIETEAKSSLLTRDTAAELIEALAARIEERFDRGWRFFARPRQASSRFKTLDAAKAFEEGIDAFDEFEYSSARTAFEAAAREDPTHPVAAAWVGRVQQVIGARDAAAKAGAAALGLLSAGTSAADRLLVEAVAAETAGNADVARTRYEELVDRFPDEPSWLMELAAFHDRQRNSAVAIDTYHRALRADARLARPHLLLCRLYNSTGTNDAALARQHGERAREVYRDLGAPGGEGQASLCLVDTLRVGDAAQRAEARTMASEAVGIYQRLGWPYNLARAYHYAAMAAGKDDLSASAALWEQALAGARQVGNGALEATVIANLGVQYHELGDFARALDYYRQSYELHERRGDARGAAYSRANAGAVMVQSGTNPEEGLRYLETALNVFAGVDSNFEMFCRQGLAEYYRHSGDLVRAERELNRAFDLANRHGFADDLPSLLLDRARLRAVQGDYTGARADLLDGLARNVGPKAQMRIDLALVHASMGDLDSARRVLGQAEQDVRAGSLTYIEPRLLTAVGLLEYESGRSRDALRQFTRAGSVREGPLPDVVEARAYAAVIEMRAGQVAPARAAGEECIEQARQMRRAGLEARCRMLLAQSRLAANPRDSARVLAEVRPDALGPELRAQLLYWRSRVAAATGDNAIAATDLAEARRLVTGLRERVPAGLQAPFSARPDIRQILD